MKATTVRFPKYQGEQIEMLAGIQQITQSKIIAQAVKSFMREAAAIHPEVATIAQAAAQAALEARVSEIKDEFGEEVLDKLYIPKPQADTVLTEQ